MAANLNVNNAVVPQHQHVAAVSNNNSPQPPAAAAVAAVAAGVMLYTPEEDKKYKSKFDHMTFQFYNLIFLTPSKAVENVSATTSISASKADAAFAVMCCKECNKDYFKNVFYGEVLNPSVDFDKYLIDVLKDAPELIPYFVLDLATIIFKDIKKCCADVRSDVDGSFAYLFPNDTYIERMDKTIFFLSKLEGPQREEMAWHFFKIIPDLIILFNDVKKHAAHNYTKGQANVFARDNLTLMKNLFRFINLYTMECSIHSEIHKKFLAAGINRLDLI